MIVIYNAMHILPRGAEALLIALQTPAPKGYTGIPVLIWGRPGEGKSSFLEALHRPDFPVLTLIASIHDPTDFSGLPVHHEGRVRYAVPEWVEEFSNGGAGILFLDELTTAPPAVQSALLRVVLERKVGFYPLPSKVRIVAAANPPDLMTGGWDLSPPLRNRFVHLDWELTTDFYLDALQNGYKIPALPTIPVEHHKIVAAAWQLRVGAFLKQAPQFLTSPPDNDEHAFASPRSWDFAIALMASCDILGLAPQKGSFSTGVFNALLKGCVGEGTAIAFAEFLFNMNLPDADKVLDGLEQVDIAELNDGEVYILFGSLQHALTRRYDSPGLVPSALHFFDLVRAVFADGRRDLIYVSLKKAARSGLLTKTLALAQQNHPDQQQRVSRALHDLFADEGLNEFIDVFEK